MKSICVFLGSNPGTGSQYMDATAALGRELARRGITCVYGGSRTGLMLQLADSVLGAGGEIVGVSVQSLWDREAFHAGLTHLHVMPTMAERKNLMIELSDAFIALPGGIGTYDEFFEVLTLRQLGYHDKPCGLLEVNGFFGPLMAMLEMSEREGFMKRSVSRTVAVSSDPAELVDRLSAHRVL